MLVSVLFFHFHSGELCIVQFPEIVNKCDELVHANNRNIKCIRKRWQQTACKGSKFLASKEYDLLLIDKIQSVVHVFSIR